MLELTYLIVVFLDPANDRYSDTSTLVASELHCSALQSEIERQAKLEDPNDGIIIMSDCILLTDMDRAK